MPKAVEVQHLVTGETITYTCSPREAVLAAHAQSLNDWSTWQYEERYGHLVRESVHGFYCGDWGVLKTGKGKTIDYQE